MSLYNALLGYNPIGGLLLDLLGVPARLIPRYRDAYLNHGDQIVIFTRTGGPNRESYERENQSLRDIPGFILDADDSFDSTFVHFVYDFPEEFKGEIPALRAAQGGDFDPLGRMQALIGDMEAGRDTPEALKALELGKTIAARLEAAIKDGEKQVALLDGDYPLPKIPDTEQ